MTRLKTRAEPGIVSVLPPLLPSLPTAPPALLALRLFSPRFSESTYIASILVYKNNTSHSRLDGIRRSWTFSKCLTLLAIMACIIYCTGGENRRHGASVNQRQWNRESFVTRCITLLSTKLTLPAHRTLLRLRLIIHTSLLGSYKRKSAWSSGRVNIGVPLTSSVFVYTLQFGLY